ncbi:hypothetical protein OUZ56_005540 [Daphnia magna]|uniref:Uncharacterized protein n=1 Tax=Daphnia magna TaxID=35525 RepID=A0ABQ9YT24_9CRUS|nr:hypothetical protein OUZ56_005540 [Daphnia magna]
MRKNTKCLTDPLSTAHLFVSAKTRLSTAIMEQNHQNGQEDAQQQPPTQIWETAAYDDWGLSAAQQYSLQVQANTPEAQTVDHSWKFLGQGATPLRQKPRGPNRSLIEPTDRPNQQ